jgi:hypothetical protein
MAAMLDLRREHSPDAWARLMILTAGICLTHYLAMLLLAFFAIIVWLEKSARDRLVPSSRHYPAEFCGAALAVDFVDACRQPGRADRPGADGFSKIMCSTWCT